MVSWPPVTWEELIMSEKLFCFVPICPKCGKLISDKRYARHLTRCGTIHKHSPRPLLEHGASADVYWGRH